MRGYNMSEVIKIKYIRDIEKIEEIVTGDWIDLRVAEDVFLHQGEFKYLPLGVAIQLPEGYEAIVAPRSSTFKNFGIIQTNSIGIIDESYCGDNDEWMLPAFALIETMIPKNTRICQFRIIKHQPTVNLVEVQTLGNKDRGGLGSTGTNEFTNKPQKLKAMLSQPMAGKTEEEIISTREKAIEFLESKGYEVINTYFTDEWYSEDSMNKRGVVNRPLCFFAKSIENMSLCDVAYFCKGWLSTRGCYLEHEVAKAYGVQIIYEDND